MKKQYLINALCGVIFALLGTTAAQAYDFEVGGLYYNIIDEAALEVEVAYRSYLSPSYSGNVVIPDNVSYNGNTYRATGIGDYAFYNCFSLTSVDIPDGVTDIGDYAFTDCFSLTSVDIPDGVTSIGNSTFSGCSSLTSVDIGNGVTSIGIGTFSSCSSLTSVNIGNGVMSIGAQAFSSCSSLTSVDIPDGVTSIGDQVFQHCSSLTSVDIPDRVTSIGDRVFYNCSDLTSVDIPDGVTSIGDRVFYNCSDLASVNIGNGVTSIGEYAFYDCSSLTSVNFPDGVTSIGNSAFSGCSRMTSVNIPDRVTSIGDRAFYNCSSLTAVNIPDRVTSIGKEAFEGSGIYENQNNWEDGVLYINNCLIKCQTEKNGEYVIKENTRLIARSAFSDCSSLTSMNIPDGVTSIGSAAFSDCSGLTSVYYTGDMGQWCEISFESGASNPLCHAQKLYIDNQLVTEAKIPYGVTEIKDYAFYSYSSLTSVDIPDGVTSIGDYAFYICNYLTSVNIPDGVTSIGNYAFCGCGLASVTIGEGVTRIGELAFFGCDALASVTIGGNGVTSIENGAFGSCSNLTSVTIGDGVMSINGAFSNCSSLTSVDIGNGVTSIGEAAFYGCSRLTSVTIGESVAGIGTRTFEGCDSLTSVTWNAIRCQNFASDNTPFFYGGYFDLREHITSFTFGDKVQHIPAWLCAGMSKLTAISLPNSVTSIGTSAFVDCPAVKDLYSHALMPPMLAGDPSSLEGHPFADLLESANLYVPCGAESDYLANSHWGMFKNIIGVEHQVLVTVDDDSRGTAALTQPVLCETSEAVIAATSHWGYVFTQWSDGDANNPRTVTVTGDTTFTAQFAPAIYQVQLGTNDPLMGSVTGGGEYAYGTTATIEAVPIEGYCFVQWSDDNTDNPRTVEVMYDMALTAEFAPKETTGLDDATHRLTVTTDHRNILVYGEAGNALSVYNVQGVCLYHGTVEAAPAIIPVPSAGLYVVMAGEEMMKVVVR